MASRKKLTGAFQKMVMTVTNGVAGSGSTRPFSDTSVTV
jgi:hypothetical protein